LAAIFEFAICDLKRASGLPYARRVFLLAAASRYWVLSHFMPTKRKNLIPVLLEPIRNRIIMVRGLRVMLDFELAHLYGVTTGRLNEQVIRNRDRFPEDFVFQLAADEFDNLRSQFAISSLGVETHVLPASNGRKRNLKSQIAISSSGYGGRRYLPYVFTEHGAIMAANVLRSPVAVAASVNVVRAFIQLRQAVAANTELAARLAELDRKLERGLGQHDAAIRKLTAAIRELMAPLPEPPAPPRELIGFRRLPAPERPKQSRRGAKARAG
jgi:hypothetical protein